MPERCPLAAKAGFYYQEDIPEICLSQCEELWEKAVHEQRADHEEYPDSILNHPECPHASTEHGNTSLQSTERGSKIRIFVLTERCTSCNEEIAEDSFQFECPNL